MSVLSEKWQKKWELKKKRVIGQKFDRLDLFELQTNGQSKFLKLFVKCQW